MIIEKKSKDQKNFTLRHIDLSHLLEGLNVGNITPKISTESQTSKIPQFKIHPIKRLTFFFNF